MTTEDVITWIFVTIQMGVPIVAAFYACRLLSAISKPRTPKAKPDPTPAPVELPVAKVVCRDK